MTSRFQSSTVGTWQKAGQKIASPSGNWTPVSRVSRADSCHYFSYLFPFILYGTFITTPAMFFLAASGIWAALFPPALDYRNETRFDLNDRRSEYCSQLRYYSSIFIFLWKKDSDLSKVSELCLYQVANQHFWGPTVYALANKFLSWCRQVVTLTRCLSSKPRLTRLANANVCSTTVTLRLSDFIILHV